MRVKPTSEPGFDPLVNPRQRGHVHRLDLYYSKLPPDAQPQEALYCSPKGKTRSLAVKSTNWEDFSKYGQKYVHTSWITEEDYNHSLSVTAATLLF